MTTGAWGAATGRAGGSAEDRYKRLHRAWWHRIRRRILGVIGVGALVLVAPAIAVAIWLDNPLWWFDAGLMVGALSCAVVGFKESPPEHIERLRTGFQGEQQTARVLKRLPRTWTALHDLDAGERRGNLDHLVVGPAGVFLLDSKWFVGETTVVDGKVRVTRYEDPDLSYVAEGLPHRMRSLARSVHDRVRAAASVNVWVTPVVVLWGNFEAQELEDCGVVYIHGDRLREWLLKQPARLSLTSVNKVASAIALPEGS